LEFFENNFTAKKQLKAHALADPNMGDVVHGKPLKIRVE